MSLREATERSDEAIFFLKNKIASLPLVARNDTELDSNDMTPKNLTCIECPKGCKLTIDFAEDGSIRVAGNQCTKGERYGIAESTNPVRILTSSVLTVNLPTKMLPVRTDHPIPKGRIFDAMREIKKIRVRESVSVGDVIVENFLGLGVNLVSTRDLRTPGNRNC